MKRLFENSQDSYGYQVEPWSIPSEDSGGALADRLRGPGALAGE